MKTALAALLVAAALSSVQPASAHEPGDIGIVFDPVTLDQCTVVPGFSVLELYIVLYEAGPIQAWEAGYVDDPAFSVLELLYTGPDPTDAGDEENYIVGLGGCVEASGDHLLATIRGGYFVAPTAPELVFCVWASEPSRVDGTGPAYVDCSGSAQVAGLMNTGGSYWANGCAVANAYTPYGHCPLPVASEPSSMGAWKARSHRPSP